MIPGASQLATPTRLLATSSRTSPGAAKILNSRAMREVVFGSSGGASGTVLRMGASIIGGAGQVFFTGWFSCCAFACARGIWLSGMDSNHDKGLQRALCYHYTTGQAYPN